MFFKKKISSGSYDKSKKVPVIRSSICTGEKVAGFRDLETGKFEDLFCIRGEKDFRNFLETYGIKPEDIKKEY